MSASARTIKKKGVFYGYYIVAAMWITYFMMSCPGAYGAGVVTSNVILDNGWNQGISGAVTSVFHLSLALTAIPISIVVKKLGVHMTGVLGAAVGVAAFTALMFLGANPIIYTVLFALVGLASNMGGVILAPVTINSWFDRNRSLPMSIVMTSGSIGGFILPLVIQRLIVINVEYCWILFITMCLIALAVDALIVRNRPEDKGEVKDGLEWNSLHPISDADGEKTQIQYPSLKKCYHTRQFYVLAMQFFGNRTLTAAISSYVILYAVQRGISTADAAVFITIYSIVGLAGRLFVGTLDKFHIRHKLANMAGLLSMVAGLLTLWIGGSYMIFMIGVALCGFGFGLSTVIFPILVTDCFGAKNFGLMYGTYNTIASIGGFSAPMAVFAIAQATGSYSYSYLVIGLLIGVCTLLSVSTPIGSIQGNTDDDQGRQRSAIL